MPGAGAPDEPRDDNEPADRQAGELRGPHDCRRRSSWQSQGRALDQKPRQHAGDETEDQAMMNMGSAEISSR